MNVTQWFDYRKNPIRKGVYQRIFYHSKEVSYSYWDGKHWHLTTMTAERALLHKRNNTISSYQDLPWRGICK